MSKVCSKVFFPGITVWSHGCLTADHQAHGAVWFQHSHTPLGIQDKVWSEHQSPHTTDWLPHEASNYLNKVLLKHSWLWELCQCGKSYTSGCLEVDLTVLGAQVCLFVSSNTRSIFLWRRAISSEKSFSTSATGLVIIMIFDRWLTVSTFLSHQGQRIFIGHSIKLSWVDLPEPHACRHTDKNIVNMASLYNKIGQYCTCWWQHFWDKPCMPEESLTSRPSDVATV